MTLPDERYRAVKMAEQLLKDLCDSSKTPRVPKIIRQRASGCLRHYPGSWDMKRAADACPDVFQERMEAVTRLFKQYEQSKNEDN
jgi:hypothetical protein